MSQEADKRPPRFLSLSAQLLLGFTLAFALIFAGAYYWFYVATFELALGNLQEDLLATLRSTIQNIDGDALETLLTQANADSFSDTVEYRDILSPLERAQNAEPRASLFIYRPGTQPNELDFILGTVGAQVPQIFKAAAQRGLITTTVRAQDGVACSVATENCLLQPGQSGSSYWVSAFTPVKNSQGEAVAALGVDFNADGFHDIWQQIQDRTLLILAVTYVVLFVLLYLGSRFLTRRLAGLAKAAQVVGDGDYEQGLQQMETTNTSRPFADETTLLTHVLESMTRKVYQREQTLREQVEVLRIEVDVAKRQKDVGEIVDSEFFQDLRSRVRTLRTRQTKGQTQVPVDEDEAASHDEGEPPPTNPNPLDEERS